MDKAQLLKSLGERFFPVLRAEGFRGSGATLRRIEPPICHVFNVQGSAGGTGFYVNLGVHLDFLPPIGGATTAVDMLMEAQCAFRQRLSPPEKLRWEYPTAAYPLSSLVRDLTSAWSSEATAFWSRYGPYPQGFEQVVHEAVRQPPRPVDSLQIARIARELGLREDAVSITESAIERATPVARSLRGDLKRLLASLEEVPK